MKNKPSIDLKTALEQTGRASECCVHCGAPLFYDIEGIRMRDLSDRLEYAQLQVKPPHLKWLVEGIEINGHTYHRNVCWGCLYKSIRRACVDQKWKITYIDGWLKDIIDGKDELPPQRMSAIGKKILPLVITNISQEDLRANSSKYDTASEESFIRRYGEVEGRKKYEGYVAFHTAKNTYEWKREHKGWTKEQFDEYNKSRAVTKENLTKRYGKEEGEKRFNAYCKLQAYAGCAVEYFKELYGEEEGERRYLEINKKKALSLEHFVEKYGKEEGEKKWNKWVQRMKIQGTKVLREILKRPYSNVSQKLFNSVLDNLNPLDKEACRFATHKGEIKLTLPNGKVTQPDFILGNKIIEFNGDYWHRNPQIYTGDLVTEDVKSIWMADEYRINGLRNLGYSVLVVWELDYNKDPEGVLKTCLDFLHEDHS